MVRPAASTAGLAALALLICAFAAEAQDGAYRSVDWRAAGGDLFGRNSEPVAGSPEASEIVRLTTLDQPYQDLVAAAARAHGLDPKLLHALVITESAYRSAACSSAGACGLTQLMPATALELGVKDRSDPAENLRGGADYLARQIVRFGDLRLALAAYNSGPDRVARLGRIPDIQETRAYVTSVIECYLALSAGRAVISSRQCPVSGTAP